MTCSGCDKRHDRDDCPYRDMVPPDRGPIYPRMVRGDDDED